MNNRNKAYVDIHLLMVIDGDLTFGKRSKGLDFLIRNLSSQIEPWATMHIWPARRGGGNILNVPSVSPTKHHVNHVEANFAFDPMKPVWGTTLGVIIERIDQIWFIAESISVPKLTGEELHFIQNFMNSGKGVFATGDHSNQGISMCGDITRVRHMRTWDGEEAYPYIIYDSIQPKTDESYFYRSKKQFESDMVGKVIVPRPYKKYQQPSPRQKKFNKEELDNAFLYPINTRPHPLLSSRNPTDAFLTMLPDHRHEGRVKTSNEIPMNEQDDWSNAQTGAEKIFWDLIASTPNAAVPRLSARDPNEEEKRSFEFGTIAAYNGFLTEKHGRIVVDSTFHHFLDYNLLGDTIAPGRRKIVYDTFENPEKNVYLTHALTYQRNIAFWLCSREKQQLISAWAFWYLISHPMLAENLDQNMTTWRAGKLTLDTLSTLVGQLYARHMWTYFFDQQDLMNIFDSFHLASSRTLEMLDEYITGTVALALRSKRYEDRLNQRPTEEKDVLKRAQDSARKALQTFACDLKAHADDYSALVETIFQHFPKQENPTQGGEAPE